MERAKRRVSIDANGEEGASDTKRAKVEPNGVKQEPGSVRSVFAAGTSANGNNGDNPFASAVNVKKEEVKVEDMSEEAMLAQLERLEQQGAAKLPDGTICPYLDS